MIEPKEWPKAEQVLALEFCEKAPHAYTLHTSYTGRGCAICGESRVAHYLPAAHQHIAWQEQEIERLTIQDLTRRDLLHCEIERMRAAFLEILNTPCESLHHRIADHMLNPENAPSVPKEEGR